jgi:hypothetical protein
MIDILTMQQGRLISLKRVSYVVLDEADRMYATASENFLGGGALREAGRMSADGRRRDGAGAFERGRQ